MALLDPEKLKPKSRNRLQEGLGNLYDYGAAGVDMIGAGAADFISKGIGSATTGLMQLPLLNDHYTDEEIATRGQAAEDMVRPYLWPEASDEVKATQQEMGNALMQIPYVPELIEGYDNYRSEAQDRYLSNQATQFSNPTMRTGLLLPYEMNNPEFGLGYDNLAEREQRPIGEYNLGNAIDVAPDLVGVKGARSLLSGQNEYDPSQLNMFAGMDSNKFPWEKYSEARKMKDEGVNDPRIYAQTGIFEGADGDIRYEIDDSKTTLSGVEGIKERFINNNISSVNRDLDQVLEHPELYEAYPHLKSYSVAFDSGLSSAEGGSFNPRTKTLTLNSSYLDDPEKLKSILLHEIQHGIQEIEGWARGGNDDMAFTSQVQKGITRNKEIAKNEERIAKQQAAPALANKEQAWNHYGDVGKYKNIEHLLRLSDNPTASNQARHLFNQSDFYKYSDEIRSKFGAYPKAHRPRWEASNWINNAAQFMADKQIDELGFDKWQALREDPRQTNSMYQAAKRKAFNSGDDVSIKNYNESVKNTRKATEQDKKYENAMPFEVYQGLAGEVEARNTQNRMNMTMEERLNSYPERTQTANTGSLTFNKGLGEFGREPEFISNENSIVFRNGRIENPLQTDGSLSANLQALNIDSKLFGEMKSKDAPIDSEAITKTSGNLTEGNKPMLYSALAEFVPTISNKEFVKPQQIEQAIKSQVNKGNIKPEELKDSNFTGLLEEHTDYDGEVHVESLVDAVNESVPALTIQSNRYEAPPVAEAGAVNWHEADASDVDRWEMEVLLENEEDFELAFPSDYEKIKQEVRLEAEQMAAADPDIDPDFWAEEILPDRIAEHKDIAFDSGNITRLHDANTGTDMFQFSEDGSYFVNNQSNSTNFSAGSPEEAREMASTFVNNSDFEQYGDDAGDASNFGQYGNMSLRGNDSYTESLIKYAPNNEQRDYTAGHFSGTNNLGHIRSGDYQDVEGNKGQMLLEQQSDWHKAGQRSGYEDPVIEKQYREAKAAEDTLDNDISRAIIDIRQDGGADLGWADIMRSMRKTDTPEQAFQLLEMKHGEIPYDHQQKLKGIMKDYKAAQDKQTAILEDNADYFSSPPNMKAPHVPMKKRHDAMMFKTSVINLVNGDGNRMYWPKDEATVNEIEGWPASSERYKPIYDRYRKGITKEANAIAKKYGGTVGTTKLENGHEVYYLDLPEEAKAKIKSKGLPLYSAGAAIGAGMLSDEEEVTY